MISTAALIQIIANILELIVIFFIIRYFVEKWTYNASIKALEDYEKGQNEKSLIKKAEQIRKGTGWQ